MIYEWGAWHELKINQPRLEKMAGVQAKTVRCVTWFLSFVHNVFVSLVVDTKTNWARCDSAADLFAASNLRWILDEYENDVMQM